jgi:hypothetical protein
VGLSADTRTNDVNPSRTLNLQLSNGFISLFMYTFDMSSIMGETYFSILVYLGSALGSVALVITGLRLFISCCCLKKVYFYFCFCFIV